MTGNNIKECLHKKLKKVNIVYGINTEVGKTYTTQAFLKEVNGKIKENFAIKPVISGLVNSEYHLSDNYKLLQALGIQNPTLQEVLVLSCYLLKEPLSPDIASWYEGINIEFHKIIDFCKEWIEKTPQFGKIFIETAGGVCSPCSNHHTMVDISKALWEYNPYNILVTTPYLGAISHTISALNMLKFDLLIINKTEDDFVKSIKNHSPYSIDIIEL